ncbi:hypothetical protein EGT29_05670 [Pigmentiphaga sp. H8]|nr:hypothetical protein EGT29_05670 [Pigmentiphaga sp. H8]
MMKPGLKSAGALALITLLSACGGGDGDAGKDGGGTPVPMSQAEIRSFAGGAYETGLFLPYFAMGAINSLFDHVGDGMPEGPLPCADGQGTRTPVYADADRDGKISAGDSLTIDMTNCATRGLGDALNGRIRIAVNEIQGDILNAFNTVGVFTLEVPELKLSASESMSGTLQVRFEQTTHDVPEASAKLEDVEETVEVSQSGGDFKLRYTEDGKDYEQAISGYDSTSHFLYATGTERYTALRFAHRGQGATLGAFDYRMALVDPLVTVYDKDGSTPGSIAGRYTVETRGETITTTFSSPAAGTSGVRIESSSGVSWSGSSDDEGGL